VTVETLTTESGPFAAGGTVYYFTFQALAVTDVKAYVGGVLAAPTVVLNADQNTSPGGSATFASATAGEVLIRREVPLDQQTEYLVGSAFPAAVHEAALDRIVMQLQDLKTHADSDVAAEAAARLAADVAEADARAAADALIIASGQAPSNVGIAPVIATGSTAARTVADRFADVVNVLDFVGADPSGVADSTAAIQAALTAGAGMRVTVPAGTYTLSGKLTIPAGTALVGAGRDQTTINWDGTGAYNEGAVYGQAGQCAVLVTGDNVTVEGIEIVGPTAASYVGGERLLVAAGASKASTVSGLTVRNCRLKNSGSAGLLMVFCEDYLVENNEVSNCGYEGIQNITCRRGKILFNNVHDITPGTGSNMYGISLTHDSANWTGPDLGTWVDGGSSPFTTDVLVQGNRVSGIAWEGISSHGGWRFQVLGNTLYDCMGSIGINGSSGSAANYAGGDHIIADNKIDSGSHAGAAANVGINISGGSTQLNSRVIVKGNSIYNCGRDNATTGVIVAVLTSRAIIEGNIIDYWRGAGINVGSSDNVMIRNNFFGGLRAADTYGYCIMGTSPNTFWSIVGNVAQRGTNTVPAIGLRTTSQTPDTVPSQRVLFQANDFTDVTTPVSTTAESDTYEASRQWKICRGSAAPAAGTWARGDQMINSAPSAAGVPGWVCTSGGSPGTWKAMANLAA
jgi:hypothetical protein